MTMKKQIAACQISVYSESKAQEIATRLRNTVKDLEKPCNPIVEDWTGQDENWPPEPEVYIFFSIEEECEVDEKEIPVKIVNAIAGENADLWIEENIVLKSVFPESVEQHVQWVGMSINQYQHTYTSRISHPHAVQYKCSEDTCKKYDKWYSLPESFELARPECPSCNKLGTKIS
jgi:hypothetical protein